MFKLVSRSLLLLIFAKNLALRLCWKYIIKALSSYQSELIEKNWLPKLAKQRCCSVYWEHPRRAQYTHLSYDSDWNAIGLCARLRPKNLRKHMIENLSNFWPNFKVNKNFSTCRCCILYIIVQNKRIGDGVILAGECSVFSWRKL